MESVNIELQANHKGNLMISLQCKDDNDYFEIPSGNEVVYNDNEYIFVLYDINSLPKKAYINDESYDVKLIKHENGNVFFTLIDSENSKCKCPFFRLLWCYKD